MSNSREDTLALAQQLTTFLRERVGEKISIIGDLTRLQGGFDTDTYGFEIENAPEDFPQSLVLRYFRHPGEAPRVVRESAIQNAAARGGPPVPSVPVDSTGELLNNRPFLLMERLPGSNLGEFLLKDQSLIQRFPGIMARLQANLHKLDSSGLRRHLESKGVTLDQMQPGRMLDKITGIANATGLSDLIALSQWLLDNYPDQPENPSICHGDLHPDNILFHNGNVSGLIDWGNTQFSHPEFDIAVSRFILSIGPPDDIGIPKEELDKMLAWGLIEYMKECHSLQQLDDSLIDYYAVLRAGHAYAKVIGKRHGVDLPYVAHDGYAWDRPDLFGAVTRTIGETTGIELVSATH